MMLFVLLEQALENIPQNGGLFNSAEFWLFIITQIIVFVGAAWGFTLNIRKELSSMQANITSNQRRADKVEDKLKEMDKSIDQIREDFNHRFTEYKDFVRDRIDDLGKELRTKVENSNTCTQKKLQQILVALAKINPKVDVENDKD